MADSDLGDAEQESSPFAGMNYDFEGRPPTIGQAGVGGLALQLAGLYKIAGPPALLAAIMIDQGSAEDALELLQRQLDEKAKEIAVKDEKRRQREANR